MVERLNITVPPNTTAALTITAKNVVVRVDVPQDYLVISVANSIASLEPGDVLLEVNREQVTEQNTLKSIVFDVGMNTPATFTFLRVPSQPAPAPGLFPDPFLDGFTRPI